MSAHHNWTNIGFLSGIEEAPFSVHIRARGNKIRTALLSDFGPFPDDPFDLLMAPKRAG